MTTPTTQSKCPTCETDLLPSGQCPRCLFGLGKEAGKATSGGNGANEQHKARHFADYRLIRLLGCGGMSVVYEASEQRTNRTVALKMIMESQVFSPVARARFLMEAEAWSRLDHPNIVPIYHFGEHEDIPFISMKFYSEGTLKDKMEQGVYRLRGGKRASRSEVQEWQNRIARLIECVARGVHHAHGKSIVHRDIKPGNILIDGSGNPQLTDFGLAKIVDEQHLSVSDPLLIKGTLPYMSPEQTRGEPVSYATDTWSLGVILYELLTGQLPFKGTNHLETIGLINDQSPVKPRHLNKHIDPDLETICLTCLEKQPGARYASTEDLAKDLENFLQGRPIGARKTSVYKRTWRWTKRNPLGTALILSLGFGLAVSMALVWLIIRHNERIRQANLHAKFLVEGTLEERTSKIWLDPRCTNLTMAAEELATLSTSGFAVPDTNGLRLKYAVNIKENPTMAAAGFMPFLTQIQKSMSAELGVPVIFDLMFCKNYYRYCEVAGGATDFQHFGPVLYWRSRELSSNQVQVVIQDTIGKHGAIVVRKDAPITNLSQFAGHSFAFPDTNATLGLWAQRLLVQAGVRGTNLSRYTNITDFVPIQMEQFIDDVDRLNYLTGSGSGVEAANRVLKGEFDGAVLAIKYVDRLEAFKTGLRVITHFRIPPSVTVARGGLNPKVIAAFQTAMLKQNHDWATLGKVPMEDWQDARREARREKIPGAIDIGFQMPDFEGLEQVRQAIASEAAQFPIP